MAEQPYYKRILEAAELLGISAPVTLAQVKQKYRDLMKKWHPDKCGHEPAKCRDMAEKIIVAYEMIIEYIEGCKFSFKEEEIRKNLPVDRHSWWVDMYGEDPLWGRWEDK